MDAAVIVAGIDEAGYGPLLGPLVVSATAFEVPRDEAEACLWRAINIAQKQDAKMPELRAVTTLSRLLMKRGEGERARELLDSLLKEFTEDIETRDVREARELEEITVHVQHH